MKNTDKIKEGKMKKCGECGKEISQKQWLENNGYCKDCSGKLEAESKDIMFDLYD